LIGKVLDNGGTGFDSEAIAGMEWAVQQGAKIVSMSLGSTYPSDGNDPMSQAVDQLSAQSGALFVVAAGNSGMEEFIGSPAAASSALTVGAVDRDDKQATFTTKGPRIGDGALKPEVTAPGVDIVAARAAGTNAGRNLSEHYTAMSGTSMATPHVAGAAAILAQRHPDWTGQQLKSALMGSAVATPKTSPTAQGLGRIDVAKALQEQVVADQPTLLFGDLAWTGKAPPPVQRVITYRNSGKTTVTLDLTSDVRTAAGVKPSLTASPAKLRIAPGGKASTTITLDPSCGSRRAARPARRSLSTWRRPKQVSTPARWSRAAPVRRTGPVLLSTPAGSCTACPSRRSTETASRPRSRPVSRAARTCGTSTAAGPSWRRSTPTVSASSKYRPAATA
jgi:hypothetical protein